MKLSRTTQSSPVSMFSFVTGLEVRRGRESYTSFASTSPRCGSWTPPSARNDAFTLSCALKSTSRLRRSTTSVAAPVT
jgi:hypothetical protein